MFHFRFWLVSLLACCLASPALAATATFAGGCFWCMEAEFSHIKGVSKVVSGYTGGTVENPTYQEVSWGKTGHVEAIEVTYDAKKIDYAKLLEIFWSNVDPTDPEGQFCDKGTQYRAGIFYHDKEQKKLAEASKKEIATRFTAPVETFIREASAFYAAEDYHQEYFKKNETRYKMYKDGCGRERTLKKLNNVRKP